MTYSTLILRPVAYCDLTHPQCPYSPALIADREVLPPQLLSRLVSRLGEFVFDEAVITCPNPLLHPKFCALTSVIRGVSRKVVLLTPVTGLSKLSRKALSLIDELVVVSASADELSEEEGRIKGLLSQGFDNLSIYAAVARDDCAVKSIFEHLEFCRKYGIQLRVGELPYIARVPVRLRDSLIAEGFEVSMPYGLRYGYIASVAFIDGYKVTILERPVAQPCRKLFIDYSGRIGKCPFTELRSIDSISSIDGLRKLIYSPCPVIGRVIEYVPEVRISLRSSNGVEIPSDILALLEVIESTNSLRAACRLLGYNLSTYVERIKSLERRLGVKLISSRRGGSLKGVTVLTREGIRILNKYRGIREAIMSALLREGVHYFTFEA